jgi:hypothetical protein
VRFSSLPPAVPSSWSSRAAHLARWTSAGKHGNLKAQSHEKNDYFEAYEQRRLNTEMLGQDGVYNGISKQGKRENKEKTRDKDRKYRGELKNVPEMKG